MKVNTWNNTLRFNAGIRRDESFFVSETGNFFGFPHIRQLGQSMGAYTMSKTRRAFRITNTLWVNLSGTVFRVIVGGRGR